MKNIFMSVITLVALSATNSQIKEHSTKTSAESGCLFATAPTSNEIPIQETLSEITAINNRDERGVVTAPATPHLKKPHGYMAASALLWNVLTDAADVSLDTVTQVGSTVTKNNSYQTNNWGWNWGVKAALGFIGEKDFWDFSLNFVYLQAFKSENNDLTYISGEQNIYPLSGVLQTLSFNNRYITATGQYNFTSFNQHDSLYLYDGNIDLAREFFISKQISLKPLAGAKGTYIRQTSEVDFTNTEGPGTFKVHNNYWGVGPQLGAGIRFGFTRHFSLEGQFDGALLWGKILNKESYINFDPANGDDPLNCYYQGNKYQVVPNLNMLAGFVYDRNFSKDTKNIAINVSYENRYFLNNIASANSVSRQKGSMTFQGANFGLKFSY